MAILDFFKKTKTKSKRGYDGAKKGRRLSSWITSNSDANSASKMDLPTLRARSRDLRRNNPYQQRAISIISNNVVGKGITTQFTGPRSAQAEKDWRAWTGSTSVDYEGRKNLAGMQRMVMEAVAESGEVFLRRRVLAGAKYPYQYQVLEADFLNASLERVTSKNGNQILQGIEINSEGKRVGYHFYEAHPGSTTLTAQSTNTNFVPANEVMHIFRADRPGQLRGVPWGAQIMIKIFDLDAYEDAELMRQKTAACFTAFVQDISADVDCDDDGEAEDLSEKLEPALIEHLPPGKTITFSDPNLPTNYKEFTASHLRAIALGYGLSYEALAGDLSEVNFSSARMGWLEMGRNIDAWRQHIIITLMLEPIVKDFKDMQLIKGRDYSNTSHNHIPPRREMIDPTKEIPSMIDEIRAGLSSRSEKIASLGKDVDEVNQKIKNDNDAADKLGLILDSDPRKIDNTGKIQQSGETGDTDEQS